jgi:ribosome-binding protein aMBF1 (putative translation factor)
MEAEMATKLDKAMDARGYKTYAHAGDAVGMTEAEKQEMDFRIDLSNAIRKRREALGLTPKDLAKRLKISKTKADKIEWGEWRIPLEELLHAYTALGGRLTIKELPPHSGNGANGSVKVGKKKARATA